MTGRQKCEAIIKEIKEGRFSVRTTVKLETWEDIWYFSLSGELYHVDEWYYACFPEQLPANIENPNLGDMRYNREIKKIQHYTGRGHWEPV